jgi:hypothetical protein
MTITSRAKQAPAVPPVIAMALAIASTNDAEKARARTCAGSSCEAEWPAQRKRGGPFAPSTHADHAELWAAQLVAAGSVK